MSGRPKLDLKTYIAIVMAIFASVSAWSAHISATKVHQPIYDVKEMSYCEKDDEANKTAFKTELSKGGYTILDFYIADINVTPANPKGDKYTFFLGKLTK
ncbi:MAG: hypothetical protein NG740_00915 [Omnitrophica bacterium]|nr:hypothetical protein [Candidatus Omnitrophota bacterium]